jgi:glycosyltransferase involved in cell wall biosynthesis
VNIVWRGPLTDPSGFASGGRAFVRGLVTQQAALRVEHLIWHWREAVTPVERELIADLIDAPRVPADVHLQRTLARLFDPYAQGRVRVGHTAWELDRVPDDWAARAAQMDELWVPCRHNADAFVAAGLERERIWVVPEAIELARLAPGIAAPLTIDGTHGTVFLSSFDWSRRKGWDALLDAWVSAFTADDDVTLVLKTWSTRGLSYAAIEAEIVAHFTSRGIDPERTPDIVLVTDLLDDRGLAGLYAACDVYVAASRGEGFCRPAAEAMAAGRPVIAVDHSGPADFVDDAVGWPVAFELVEVDEASRSESPVPDGARWAEPDVDDLGRALADAHRDAEGRRARGEAALAAAGQFDHVAIAGAALTRLETVEPRRNLAGVRNVRDSHPCVLLTGSIFGAHSLSAVNRELARAIVDADTVELGLLETEGAKLDTTDPAMRHLGEIVSGLLPRVDVTIRHSYPPCFDPGAAGRLVQFLHWEFGPVPESWVRAHDDVIDEVWAATHWVRTHMVASGMDPARVHVVPLGIDPARFRPGRTPLDLGDAAPGFRFLFVGGLLWRKGVDILFDAYERAFDRSDDVTLVVKDFGSGGPYASQDGLARMTRLAQNPRAGRVAHFTGTLPEDDLPRLYAACDCLVHPYRGEGYGLTIAEAMACGLPVIVPDLGACRDYADADTALLVPAQEAQLGHMDIGGHRLVDFPRLVEVEVDDLAAAMRRAYENRAASAAVGAAASAHMHRAHTWAHGASIALSRIAALTGTSAPLTRT